MNNNCPSDPSDFVDLLVAGHLEEAEAEAFVDHAQSCASCAEELGIAFEFATAIRTVAGSWPEFSAVLTQRAEG